ncbi:MAG: hypothetical protein ABR607_10755 [Pyrinomonadaceae bacterium]
MSDSREKPADIYHDRAITPTGFVRGAISSSQFSLPGFAPLDGTRLR